MSTSSESTDAVLQLVQVQDRLSSLNEEMKKLRGTKKELLGKLKVFMEKDDVDTVEAKDFKITLREKKVKPKFDCDFVKTVVLPVFLQNKIPNADLFAKTIAQVIFEQKKAAVQEVISEVVILKARRPASTDSAPKRKRKRVAKTDQDEVSDSNADNEDSNVGRIDI